MTSGKHVQKTLCFYGFSAWLMLVFLYVGGLVLCLWLIWKLKEGLRYRKSNRIDGKVVIITGCNTGIGKETALELARRGGRIYMACRDATRCETARLEIIERTGNQNVFNRTLDLASLASVRNFAVNFLAEEDRLDILINNAGICDRKERALTVDGYEQHLAVNHLGHFLLTYLLLELLKASAPSRIVVVSSLLYLNGRIRQDDLNSEQKYSNIKAYSRSKLANLLFTRKLSELLKDSQVTVNALHPGVVHTNLMRVKRRPAWFWSCVHFHARFVMKTPCAGAQTSIRLAIDPALEKTSGGFYGNTLRWPILPIGRDKNMANWLWKESERMVGLRAWTAKTNGNANASNNGDEDTESVVINNL